MSTPHHLTEIRKELKKEAKKFFRIDPSDVVIGFLAIVAFLVFVPVFTYVYFARDLQSPDTIMNRKDTGVVLLDDKDRPFFTFYQAKYKNVVSLSDIPVLAREAVISSEDKTFYSNPGFSISSIIRSALEDFQSGSLSYGGSTITQQLVKNSLLDSNKNFLRKYQEIVLASELGRRYSKDQILEMYLNSVYFGEGAFGIEQAAQTYFGKDAKDLDLAESALLAGLLPAPSKYSPLSNDPAQAKINQEIILQKMADQGFITPDEKVKALNEKLSYKPAQVFSYQAPAFALMVKQELIDKFGEEMISRSGFQVKTTLDLDMQMEAQKVVAHQVANLKGDGVSNGAAVILDPKTGEIKALVGSIDWNNPDFGRINMAATPRQPGSSFKPIIYADALEQKMITPETVLQDTPTTFNQCPNQPPPLGPSCIYKPVDYDHRFWGPVTVRRALANSRNVPAVQVMQKVGVTSALDMAKRMGVTSLGDDPSKYGLSLVLGAGEVPLVEMTEVYATLDNQGQRITPTTIESISDKYGDNVYAYSPSPEQVVSPEVAYILTSILSDPTARHEEFGTAIDTTDGAAVKTGTTNDFRDAWTLGYTPDLAVGVWVGNDDNQPMDSVAGSLGAAPIFKDLIEKYSPQKAVFTPPGGLDAVWVCRSNGLKLNEASSSGAVKEYFLPGTEPTGYCNSPRPSPAPSGSPVPGQPPAPPNPTPAPTPPPNNNSGNGSSTTTTTTCINGACTTTVTH